METKSEIEDVLDGVQLGQDETSEHIDGAAQVAGDAEGSESVVIFGDDEPAEEAPSAPDWVKDLRKQNRKQAQKIAELEKQNKAKSDDTISPLSAKPTLEGSEYDEGKYAEALESWYGEKATHTKAQQDKAKEEGVRAEAWQKRMGEYTEAKSAFDVEAIDDAEAIAREALSDTQQGVLIEALGANAAALLVGLSANKKRLRDLAGVKNPIRFAAEAARLESIMKTLKRTPKSAPESRVAGNGSISTGDQSLEKLEAEADRTGDRTKIIAFKRKQRQAKK